MSANTTNEWTKMLDLNGVVISQKVAKCSTQYNTAENDYFVFKYKNSNNYNVRVTYKIELWVGENCRSCDLQSPNEYEISIDIKAGETLEYSCSDDNHGFKLFKSSPAMNNNDKISFKFVDLKINKI